MDAILDNVNGTVVLATHRMYALQEANFYYREGGTISWAFTSTPPIEFHWVR
jgi:hypothetical protein